MILNVKINGVKYSEAIGNIGSENLKKPYPAIFKSIAARITEPAVGASTWASGNQVCTGHIGVLTANEPFEVKSFMNYDNIFVCF